MVLASGNWVDKARELASQVGKLLSVHRTCNEQGGACVIAVDVTVQPPQLALAGGERDAVAQTDTNKR